MKKLKVHWDKVEKLENEVIQFNQIKCFKRPSTFFKDFVLINEEKMNYCFEMYKKTLEMNNDKMREFLGFVKMSANSISKLRMGYYCSLCNAEE